MRLRKGNRTNWSWKMHHLTRAQTIKRLQPPDDGDDNLARTWPQPGLWTAFLWLRLGDWSCSRPGDENVRLWLEALSELTENISLFMAMRMGKGILSFSMWWLTYVTVLLKTLTTSNTLLIDLYISVKLKWCVKLINKSLIAVRFLQFV